MTCSSARLIMSILRKMPSCSSREISASISPPKSPRARYRAYLQWPRDKNKYRTVKANRDKGGPACALHTDNLHQRLSETYCRLWEIAKRKTTRTMNHGRCVGS